MIETELSGQPNLPWQADSERRPSEAPPPPAKPAARTVFGLAGELKNLVREDRMHRSEQARRLNRAENFPLTPASRLGTRASAARHAK